MTESAARRSVVPRVKYCGLGRSEDVAAAADAGGSYAGLVLAESPRRLAPEAAARLARQARGLGLAPVGVFVDRPATEVRWLADELDLAVVQLHGSEAPEVCGRLRASGLEVWKAARPCSREELDRLVARYRDAADALLVEGWSAERAGGTGTAFPHRWLEAGSGGARPTRLVLAGGLDPDNVGEAVRRVRPDVVDVSSGVERVAGRKDGARMRAFGRAVREAVDRETANGGEAER